MLEYLKLANVGPSPAMELHFKRRLNFLTGDNGLGKTFLLDIAWWALTRTWSGAKAIPLPVSAPRTRSSVFNSAALNTVPFNSALKSKPKSKAESRIDFGYRTSSRKLAEAGSTFSRSDQMWSSPGVVSMVPAIVIYAHVDGGFSAWDPARNNRKSYKSKTTDSKDSFCFETREVWDGMPIDQPKKICNGLISDWASWQRENGGAFAQLTSVLKSLSPSPNEPLRPGTLTRIDLEDTRDQPTLALPYNQEVPLAFASSAIRRIVSLAYLLVWTWQEHLRACLMRGVKPVREIIFLIDEIEAHLHPQWQRRIVRAMSDVMSSLTGTDSVSLQMIATTHSPLILASLEPQFRPETDIVWELDLVKGKVELSEFGWSRQGDVNRWLTSSVFDLYEPRSLEGEEALRDAREILTENSSASLDRVDEIDQKLRRALSDIDPFWMLWRKHLRHLRGDDD